MPDDYQVGPGVWDAMEYRGDKPITDSDFLNTEIGYGEKGRYIATKSPGRLWEVEFIPWSVETTPAVIDLRGALPVRAGAAPYPLRPIAEVKLFVVHHTASSSGATAQSTASYQTGPTSHLPFPALAYHYFVHADGAVHRCHDFTRRTWGSNGSYQGQKVNDIAVHCCYAGNDNVTAAQIAGMHTARLDAERELGRGLLVRGHGDDDATECPGASWDFWRDRI